MIKNKAISEMTLEELKLEYLDCVVASGEKVVGKDRKYFHDRAIEVRKLISEKEGQDMEKYFVIIKVKDKVGNWYNNALIENEFDAIQVAKFYRDELGYSVQLWKQEKDITFLLDNSKTVIVKS